MPVSYVDADRADEQASPRRIARGALRPVTVDVDEAIVKVTSVEVYDGTKWLDIRSVEGQRVMREEELS